MNVTPFNARRSMAMCAHGNKLYFFGGVGKNYTESILDVANDFWSYDPETKEWAELSKNILDMPSPRRCVGFLSSENKLFLWGGSSIYELGNKLYYDFLNDFWEYDIPLDKWKQIEQSDDNLESPLQNAFRPVPRYTPVFEKLDNLFVLFGGYTEDRLGKRKLNDLWIYDENKQWEQIEQSHKIERYDFKSTWPGIRYGCMSATCNEKLYICGGFSDDGDHIDVWEFDSESKEWTILSSDEETNAPNKRYCASLVFYNNKLILFGGRSRKNPKANFNDMYEFDLIVHSWKEIYPNSNDDVYSSKAMYPAYHAKSSFCIHKNFMYLWGGEGLHGHVSDFWKLNLDSYRWEILSGTRDDDPVFW